MLGQRGPAGQFPARRAQRPLLAGGARPARRYLRDPRVRRGRAGLAVSEYLRLRRQQTAPGPAAGVRGAPLARALAKTLAVLATGLAAYLSVNAVTHPATMALRATHWASWPAEGTLRAAALLACAGSAAVLRWLLAPARPAVPPGGSGATARQPPGRPT